MNTKTVEAWHADAEYVRDYSVEDFEEEQVYCNMNDGGLFVPISIDEDEVTIFEFGGAFEIWEREGTIFNPDSIGDEILPMKLDGYDMRWEDTEVPQDPEAHPVYMEQYECRDGSTRYDITFEIDGRRIKTESWSVPDDEKHSGIHVTFPDRLNDPVIIGTVRNQAEQIIENCEECPWYFNVLEYGVSVGTTMYKEWEDYDEVGYALHSACDEAADERGQYGCPSSFDRSELYSMLREDTAT